MTNDFMSVFVSCRSCDPNRRCAATLAPVPMGAQTWACGGCLGGRRKLARSALTLFPPRIAPALSQFSRP